MAIMALSWLYVLFGGVGIVAAGFFGLKAAVLAIVLQALMRIGSRTLRNGPLRGVAAAAFVTILFLGIPFPLIILTAGLAGLAGARAGLAAFQGRSGHGAAGGPQVADTATLLGEEIAAIPAAARRGAFRAGAVALAVWLAPVGLLVLLAGSGNVCPTSPPSSRAWPLSPSAALTRSSPTSPSRAVLGYGWLGPGEMLDGLGMAETTPGPLIMVLQFVGLLAAYRGAGWASPLLAGTLGGLLATWVTFAPCFAWIFLGAPFIIEWLRGNRALAAALTAVSAAVVGVILNLAVWFAMHVVFHTVAPVRVGPLSFDLPLPGSIDWLAAILTAGAVIAVFCLKLGIGAVLGGAVALGVVLGLAGAL